MNRPHENFLRVPLKTGVPLRVRNARKILFNITCINYEAATLCKNVNFLIVLIIRLSGALI